MSLSVLLPSIRTQNVDRLYDSICSSYSKDFELIVVGPTPLPLHNRKEIRFIQDWGSPSRAQQIALLFATKEYVTWAADDGWFLPGGLDRAVERFKTIQRLSSSYNNVVSTMYKEGPGLSMTDPNYYKISAAPSLRAKHIPENYLCFNLGIAKTEDIKNMGGWDCQFEVATIAHMDLAVRLQKAGFRIDLFEEQIFECEHEPGRSGTHFAIHDAQTEHDEPLFRQVWNTDPIYENRIKIERRNINLYNCFTAKAVWERRFKG